MIVLELDASIGQIQAKDLVERLARAAQPIEDGASDDHADYFDWAVALSKWRSVVEAAMASGALVALDPVSMAPEVPALGECDLGEYWIPRRALERWAPTVAVDIPRAIDEDVTDGQSVQGGQSSSLPEAQPPDAQDALQRSAQIAKRHQELKAQGIRNYTERIAAEFQISKTRVRQILQKVNVAESPGPTAHNPFGQTTKRRK